MGLWNIGNELFAEAGWFMLGGKNRKEIKKNKEFQNKYSGKRCFIIGNGPSLNKQDLSLLKDEYVFTVNQMMRDKRFEQLQSNFHIIADPLYFNLDLENEYHKKIIELLKKIKTINNSPECFFPIQAKQFIDKLELDLPIHYFFFGCNMYEGYRKKINYAKSVPGFFNVVQFAITLAIYCGFSEIYLIGCDMTGYREVEENAYGNYEEDKHCYHLSEEEKKNVFEDRSDEIMESSVTARLLSFPNVIITSHQGFFTYEALSAISETTLDNARAFIKGERNGHEVE